MRGNLITDIEKMLNQKIKHEESFTIKRSIF